MTPSPQEQSCRVTSYLVDGKTAVFQHSACGASGTYSLTLSWRQLARSVLRCRPLVVTVIAGESTPGRPASGQPEPGFTEKHFDPGLTGGGGDRARMPSALPDPRARATLTLPGGTVLSAAGHDALVARFTAHARVLIGNGMCPLHEMPLMSIRGGGVRHRRCTQCGRDWFDGNVSPYVINGDSITGGEPLNLA